MGHCCGGVTKIVAGRHHDGRRGRQASQKQHPPSQRPPARQQRPAGRTRPVPSAMPDDVATLEAQAARLRSSIVRRRKFAGCSNESDNVSDIISHYEKVLEGTEQQLRELRVKRGEAEPLASPAHCRTDSGSTTCSSAGNW